MIPDIEEIFLACHSILKAVREKAKEELNPILHRIQIAIEEFQTHLLEITWLKDNVEKQKFHWGILYRDGDVLDEMTTLIKNTTSVFIEKEVNYIKQCLVFFTQYVVKSFGQRESLFIITPKFQALSGI